MSSMNSRFKSLGFGKRKSTASIQTPEGLTPSPTPPPGQIPQPPQQQQLHASSIAPSSSTTSLPMNHPGPGNRPPSYTANFPPGQAPLGRTSPLTQQPNRTPPTQMVGGPPPINTGAPMGYPPGMAPMGQGGPPPMGGPPGFGQQPPPPQGYPPPGPPGGPMNQQFQRPGPAAEVEGASKSKAQLIVGIDFVGALTCHRHDKSRN